MLLAGDEQKGDYVAFPMHRYSINFHPPSFGLLTKT